MITWFSMKHTFVALSSIEVEYMVVSMDSCESIWLIGLFDHELEPMVIYCDNHSCIELLENTLFHDRFKHIKIRCQFIQNRI
jgi:hypothetical protein